MKNASTSVASGPCARALSRPSVRSHFITGGAVASAGILALGLVVAPPDVSVARTEVRAVRLAALTLPSTVSSAAVLEMFVRNQVQTNAPVTRVIPSGGAADIKTAVATLPRVFVRADESTGFRTQVTPAATIDPAIENPGVNTASVATLGASLGDLPTILFNLVVVAPFAIAFFGLIALVSFLQGVFAPVGALATAAPLASDPMVSDSARVTSEMQAPADAKAATDAGSADISPQVATVDKRTNTEQVKPKKDTAETVEPEEVSMRPTAVSDVEPSGDAAGSEKPTAPRATPRPVVRTSLRADEQQPDPPHRDKGGHPNGRTAATIDDATGSGSSSESPSPAGSSSKGRGFARGSADGDRPE